MFATSHVPPATVVNASAVDTILCTTSLVLLNRLAIASLLPRARATHWIVVDVLHALDVGAKRHDALPPNAKVKRRSHGSVPGSIPNGFPFYFPIEPEEWDGSFHHDDVRRRRGGGQEDAPCTIQRPTRREGVGKEGILCDVEDTKHTKRRKKNGGFLWVMGRGMDPPREKTTNRSQHALQSRIFSWHNR